MVNGGDLKGRNVSQAMYVFLIGGAPYITLRLLHTAYREEILLDGIQQALVRVCP